MDCTGLISHVKTPLFISVAKYYVSEKILT